MVPVGTCGRAGGWGAGAGLCPTPCLDLLVPPASAAPSPNRMSPGSQLRVQRSLRAEACASPSGEMIREIVQKSWSRTRSRSNGREAALTTVAQGRFRTRQRTCRRSTREKARGSPERSLIAGSNGAEPDAIRPPPSRPHGGGTCDSGLTSLESAPPSQTQTADGSVPDFLSLSAGLYPP